MIDNELLTFEYAQNPPTKHAAIARDDNDVLIAATRSRNANSEWEVREYRVYGEQVLFHVDSVKRADLAAVFVEEFDGDELAEDARYNSRTPIRQGVPVAVAVDGTPAVGAWLYVRGEPRDEIRNELGVGKRTLTEYLSRFRRRGTALKDKQVAPAVGEIVPELPPEMNYSTPKAVADEGRTKKTDKKDI